MTFWVLPSLVASLSLASFLVYAIVHRPPRPMWPSVPAALLAGLLFALGDSLTFFWSGTADPWPPVALLYTGIIFVAPTWWLLAHRFAEVIGEPFPWGRSRWIYLPFVSALLLWIGMITNPWHSQFVTLVRGSRNVYHWLWWLHSTIGYALVLTALGLFVLLGLKATSRLRRRRIGAMIAAPILNLACNQLYVFSSQPLVFDPTVVALALSGALFLVGIYRVGFFSLSPVAITKILHHQPNGIIVTDIEGGLLYWNPAAEAALRASLAEVHTDVHDWLGELLASHESPDEPVGGDALRKLLKFRTNGAEPPLYQPIGKGEYWVSVQRVTIASRGIRPVGYSFQIEDHSQRRREEQSRAALQEQMAQTQKLESLGVLAGGIAHDFNNLLMAIRGNTELARVEQDLPGQVRSQLDAIGNASDRAARLTAQLLAYAGAATTEARTLDVSDLVGQTAELLRTAVLPHGLSLALELDGALWMRGDQAQIEQILMNLTINAAEAYDGSGGEVTIQTGVLDADSDYLEKCLNGSNLPAGTLVFAEVRDSGSGMRPESVDSVFDPFFSTKGSGRGLGLAAVLGIVRSHQGALRIDTQWGYGTRIRVLFPQQAPPEEVLSPEMSLDSSPLPAEVLVVDDEDAVRRVICGLLGRAGMSTVSAQDGSTAASILGRRGDQIEMAILDVAMPEMDGFATLRALREIRPELPVVLMSGHPLEDLESRIRAEQRVYYLMKPFSESEIVQKIRKAHASTQVV